MTDRHRAAERRFRDLLTAQDLPQPDAVEDRDDEIVLLWRENQVAVVVELEG